MPRLQTSAVVAAASRDGLGLLTWASDSFAYADSFDESAGRYRGLRSGERMDLSWESATGLLVKPDVAQKQQSAETAAVPAALASSESQVSQVESSGRSESANKGYSVPMHPTQNKVLKRFHGTVTLDATRVGRDAGRIADEVIAHLAGQVGATVTVTLEIEA